MHLFDFGLWSKIFTNLALMFSLTTLIISANKVGLLEYLYKPLNKITNSRLIMFAWFMIATFLSAFTLDLTLALILLPIAVLYAEFRGLSKSEILLATTWGNMVGSEWTCFGGGDTIVGWSLMEKFVNRPLDIMTWGSLFWTPSLLSLIGTSICLFLFVKKSYVVNKEINLQRLSFKSAAVAILFIAGIAGVFLNVSWYSTLVVALMAAIIARLGKNEIKKMPFKGVYIWTACILIGTLIGNLIKTNYQFVIPEYMYSLFGVVLVLFVVCALTNIMTNTGLTTIILPLIMASQFIDTLWLYVLVTKAISMSYLTIFANSSLVVSSSYGMTQKDMLKKGSVVVLVQLAIFVVYFYFMRGNIYI